MKTDYFYNDDSIIGLKYIPTNSVHAIISDIPYGINYDDWDVLHSNTNKALGGSSTAQLKNTLFKRRGKPLNGWSEADKLRPVEYQNWVSSWAGEWERVVKPGGSVFVFAGRQFSHRVTVAFEEAGFTFKDMLSWERDKAPHRAQRLSKVYERRGDVDNEEKWSGWRVANLRPMFEPILWFQKPYKTGGTIADNVLENGVGAWNEQSLVKWNKNQNSLNQSNVIKVDVLADDRKYHTTQKPLNLMKLLVELVTVEQQIVLDPFAGSGTTLLAAKELNRRYIGYEKDFNIYKIGEKRLEHPSF
ncbi:DNA-methyltransferase [Streptococcus constellatus]|uniref:Methyltransferase n=1 Tax=Streptococcus constellatus TaxID=76860 RepID=A0A0C1KG15_STRCV|nr:site-specific DNA-methyltransferase [Streptococcus constellatus]KIC77847.1 modification methylase [Streptococcus constellatus]